MESQESRKLFSFAQPSAASSPRKAPSACRGDSFSSFEGAGLGGRSLGSGATFSTWGSTQRLFHLVSERRFRPAAVRPLLRAWLLAPRLPFLWWRQPRPWLHQERWRQPSLSDSLLNFYSVMMLFRSNISSPQARALVTEPMFLVNEYSSNLWSAKATWETIQGYCVVGYYYYWHMQEWNCRKPSLSPGSLLQKPGGRGQPPRRASKCLASQVLSILQDTGRQFAYRPEVHCSSRPG